MNAHRTRAKKHVPRLNPGLLSAAFAALALASWTSAVRADCHVVQNEEWVDGHEIWDCLEIKDGAWLFIGASASVTLTGNNGTESTIDGHLILVGCGSTLAISTRSHTITGAGKIVGQNNSAQITIASEKTLYNETTIGGALQIHGPGTFQNDGLVEAKYVNESGYILTLYSGTFSGGTSEACEGYKVADEEATLYVGATGSPDTDDMSAAFLIEDGTLDIEWIVVTSGGLRFIGGTISVDLNRSFTATGTPASCPP